MWLNLEEAKVPTLLAQLRHVGSVELLALADALEEAAATLSARHAYDAQCARDLYDHGSDDDIAIDGDGGGDGGDGARHRGVVCAYCDKVIEKEVDGTSSPFGSMHTACAVVYTARHPEQW